MAAEPTQQKGKDGADFAKRWLESTTWIELPFNAYRTPMACQLHLLKGKPKLMDLAGKFLTPPHNRLVYVEAKNYDQSGKLPSAYEEFLAAAYSATAAAEANLGKAVQPIEFIFIAKHPFGALKEWSNKVSVTNIQKAVGNHPEMLGDVPYDSDIAARVADRTWLLIYHDKQNELTLSTSEVGQVLSLLNRKEDGVS